MDSANRIESDPDAAPASGEGADAASAVSTATTLAGTGEPLTVEQRAMRLNDAAVSLIEPLMEYDNVADIARRLADAVQRCAQAADLLGLRSLNYLAALVVPFLRQRANQPAQAEDRDPIEQWTGDLVAYCAGQLGGHDSHQLVASLQSWRGFPNVPAQFVELIGERLRADSMVIAQWQTQLASQATVEHQPAPLDQGRPATAAEAAHEAGSEQTPASEQRSGSEPTPGSGVTSAPEPSLPIGYGPERGSAPVWTNATSPLGEQDPLAAEADPGTEDGADRPGGSSPLGDLPADGDDQPELIARDELDMLAEAAETLGADVVPQLLSIPLPDDDGSTNRHHWVELLEDIDTRIGHVGNAAGFIGARGLVDLLAAIGEQLRAWRHYGAAVNEDTRRLLTLTPDALARFFRSPQQDTADELAGLMADSGWPQPLTVQACTRLSALLGSMQVIDSRIVTVDDREPSADDLSLQIPADADRTVVEHLLQELPALSGEFSESIESLRAGAVGELQRAQRLAHTLKGSANTVGVRGIANLTHRLEDILQLLVKADHLPPLALRDHLAEAADCLAEMCESVAGVGPAPAQALEVYRRTVEWMNRLVRDGVPDEEPVVEALLAKELAAKELAAKELAAKELARPASVPEAVTEVAGLPAAAGMPEAAAAGDEFVPHADASAVPAATHTEAVTSLTAVPSAIGMSSAGMSSAKDAPSPVHSDPVKALFSDQNPLAAPDASDAPAGASPVAPPVATPEAPPEAGPSIAAEQPVAEEELLRVPGRIVDRLLDVAGEAVITLSQLQQRIAMIDSTRLALRAGSERLQDLSGELERLVDVRGLAVTGRTSERDQRFDSLELDEYNDLHTVSRRIAEAAADNKLLDQQFDRQVAVMRDFAAQLERAQTELREQAMHTRMVPVATISGRLQRAMRQAARMAGKQVQLVIGGEDTDVDSHLLQSLVDPLTHMLRNSVDHGIEAEAQRSSAGKPPAGTIRVDFRRDAASLVVELRDDGQGLDVERIRDRALALGLIDDHNPPSPADLSRLILLPGFSTRSETTQLSGRGIGLNVVHQRLTELRGKIDIRTSPGEGSVFTLVVPLRMATVPVMIARSASHVLALSIRDIQHIATIDHSAVTTQGNLMVSCAGVNYDAVRLETLLRLPAQAFAREDGSQVALIVRQADNSLLAVVAPELSQSRNVILRPLPSLVPPISGIAGLAVLGDGTAAPVVDLPDLISHRDDVVTQYAQVLASHVDTRPVCLIVDDSVSVRRSMELFLQDLGLQVDSAADGLEALAAIEKRVPELIIVDLEMPRMNGVELTTAVRAAPATAGVPVIMITSRYSDKHKSAAMAAGVDVFMTKPYTEDELAAHVQRTLYRALG